MKKNAHYDATYDATDFYVFFCTKNDFSKSGANNNANKNANKNEKATKNEVLNFLKNVYPYKIEKDNVFIKKFIFKKSCMICLYLGKDRISELDKIFILNAILRKIKIENRKNFLVQKISLCKKNMKKNQWKKYLFIFIVMLFFIFCANFFLVNFFTAKKNQFLIQQKNEQIKKQENYRIEQEKKLEKEKLEKEFILRIENYPTNPYLVLTELFKNFDLKTWGENKNFYISNISVKDLHSEIEIESQFSESFITFLEKNPNVNFIDISQISSFDERQKTLISVGFEKKLVFPQPIDEEKIKKIDERINEKKFISYSAFVEQIKKSLHENHLNDFLITKNKQNSNQGRKNDKNFSISVQGSGHDILEFLKGVCSKYFVSSVSILSFPESQTLRLSMNIVFYENFLDIASYSAIDSDIDSKAAGLIHATNLDNTTNLDSVISAQPFSDVLEPVKLSSLNENLFYDKNKSNKTENSFASENISKPEATKIDFNFILIAKNKGKQGPLLVKKTKGGENGKILKILNFEETENEYLFDCGGKLCGIKK